MNYDLLVEKVKQIGENMSEGNLSDNKLKPMENMAVKSIMPSLEFNCSGTITGFLLGVDVRTKTNSRDEYPTIWLWNKTGETTYTRVDNSSVEIILGPSNFSTDGVYQFSLSTPLQFTADQVLGIYQPNNTESVVRFYYQDYSCQDIYETPDNASNFTLSTPIRMNWRPLIHPQSSMLYTYDITCL